MSRNIGRLYTTHQCQTVIDAPLLSMHHEMDRVPEDSQVLFINSASSNDHKRGPPRETHPACSLLGLLTSKGRLHNDSSSFDDPPKSWCNVSHRDLSIEMNSQTHLEVNCTGSCRDLYVYV